MVLSHVEVFVYFKLFFLVFKKQNIFNVVWFAVVSSSFLATYEKISFSLKTSGEESFSLRARMNSEVENKISANHAQV